MGQADDVERVEAGCRAQPQSLCKRRVAEQGGDAGGGSTLGTPSAFAQMGHIDSPGRSRLSRDIHFEKSPKFVVSARVEELFAFKQHGSNDTPFEGPRR